MNTGQLLDYLKHNPDFASNVTHWQVMPARPAKYADYPDGFAPALRAVLESRGVKRLYSHQRRALDLAQAGKDFVVITPTASGKTMCYNLPVLSEILRDNESRALYLFPTKALSSDQVAELYEIIKAMDAPIKAFTFDGDTPVSARKAIRQAGHIVVTNPDMLHAGILPHHTKWVKLFENLKYIVIDEIHAYRGIFGSNLANVIRRLKRICEFYGSHPQFICCSATIANPRELAERLTGRPMELIAESGAPTGEKHVIFYNPPVVNKQLNIRDSALKQTFGISRLLLKNGVHSIVFARSRLMVEVLARRLKDQCRNALGEAPNVRAYRGGYLPSLRHQIEQELRAGQVDIVVSTNALELGIDIGRLDVCVLCGYPGTIASTWQQAGRAGRRQGVSALIMVATSSPLDQYIIAHPEYFFSQPPEHALINPDNLYILLNHFKCAAYELPFEDGEQFGDVEATPELLEYLCEQNILNHVGNRYYWTAEEFPQAGISLRSASDQNFLIIDISVPGKRRVIGEMDRFTVPMLLHQYAIYLHEGRQYQVEELDFDDKKAYVRAVDVDYYTDANLTVTMKVLDVFREKPGVMAKAAGEVLVSSIVTLFKKMKLDTQENLGWGPVTLPELEMQTTACWWTLPDSIADKYTREELQGAMVGISHIIEHIAPVFLMCSPRDIGVVYHVRDPFTNKPTLFLYDNCAGGVGLSDRVYEMDDELFKEARRMLMDCPCADGCPSCVGPPSDVGAGGKRIAIELLGELTNAVGT
ncbi:MAG: DEAD/DEAH box helicase [Clostridiales bacterium]|nr:DEAD/DEAH box helicase [Clostridiales bacterium]MDY4200297.1 DEAD/DEAH box helicase [Candidatus Fimadaptatus sp.]